MSLLLVLKYFRAGGAGTPVGPPGSVLLNSDPVTFNGVAVTLTLP